jgi:hypothetical protein
MINKSLRILSFFSFPAAVFFLSIFIGHFFNFYDLYPWIDIPMHFLGGFSVAYMIVLFLRFWKEEKLITINSKIIFILIIVCAVSFIAVLWEFWEYLMDLIFKTNFILSLEDTLSDLVMGILGGLTGAVLFRKI